MLGLVNVKVMLINNVDEIILIHKVVIVNMTMPKHNAFPHRKKTEAKPQHVYKGFSLYKINQFIHN